jgi:hypothetical protein
MPQKTYCSIRVWLEQHCPQFLKALTNHCLDGQLYPRRGTPGITLLLPDKKTIDKLQKELDSDSPDNAIMQVKTLILRDVLFVPDHFMIRKDDIPNALNQKLQVKSATSSSVELANGAKITIEKTFIPRDEKTNVMVYNYSGALQPIDGDPSSFKYQSKPRLEQSKKGGWGVVIGNGKQDLARAIESRARCLSMRSKEEYFKNNPYASAMSSLYNFMLKKAYTESSIKMLHLIEPCPEASFYGIVLPYTEKPGPFDKEITDWITSTGAINLSMNPLQDWVNLCETKIEDPFDKIRNSVTVDKKNPYDTILQAYQEIPKINNGFMNVYNDPELHMAADEMRFMINMAIHNHGDGLEWSQILNDLILDMQIMYKSGCPAFITNNPNQQEFFSIEFPFNISRNFLSVNCEPSGVIVDFKTYCNKNVDQAETISSDSIMLEWLRNGASQDAMLKKITGALKYLNDDDKNKILEMLKS